ncbi:adenine deaminase [Falsiroseomonas bella]|uniref:Adenine deaminase n=1 Tax=Falsiroseomonas bella TaxID=2184016 RepID=A0A317FC40_9PROT|nr:adenine deaminase [Falsiroseomonas bella]PWS36063.1 adenine deaminase [Falsiroseomonas bella]
MERFAADIAAAIEQGRGATPADLVLKGGRVFDLVTGALTQTDVAICADRIVGTHGTYHGRQEIDVAGLVLVPGFIDTHLHIESSLVTPFEFDRCVTPRGVTTAICDPHEIANVAGIGGLRYFLQAAERTVMDLRVQLSSCVPATEMETSGARLSAADLLPLARHPKVIGLAEFMNYPGVLHGDPECLAKLRAFQGRHIDGHAPLLRGMELNGYLAAGIRTDHEATSAAEALEKLSKGMAILVREGSVSKDLHALASIITERHSPFLAFCTDDRNPLDIAEHGHLDHMIRTAIALGAEPLAVYRAASHSAARIFGLSDRGLIAPGWRADIVAIDALETCRARLVLCGGVVADDAAFARRETIPPIARGTVRAPRVSAADFRRPAPNAPSPVIGIIPGRIITERLEATLPVEHGASVADPAADLAKIAIVERHGVNGNRAVGFVKGFGLQHGAIASTVCHDHHNIAVLGASEDDMALACNRLGEIEGGFVVAAGGQVLAEVALPIAGLMSLKSFEDVQKELFALRAAARSLGVTLDEPFLQLAFLALPVIPHLKITDRGMVDVDRFALLT